MPLSSHPTYFNRPIVGGKQECLQCPDQNQYCSQPITPHPRKFTKFGQFSQESSGKGPKTPKFSNPLVIGGGGGPNLAVGSLAYEEKFLSWSYGKATPWKRARGPFLSQGFVHIRDWHRKYEYFSFVFSGEYLKMFLATMSDKKCMQTNHPMPLCLARLCH